jgi:pimeloyl-ACP methyl ester carboxylesterase
MTDADLSANASSAAAESIFIPASDGIRLYVKVYRPAAPKGLPVICLPGLARTEADFEALAHFLVSDPAHPRAVFALDYRGRGQSGYDPDWRNYNLAVELADLVTALTALGVQRAVFVGTSRGGLLTMLLAATQPAFIAGAILNDIGPVIEPKGLMRIKGYIGKMPAPKDFAEGAEALRRLFGAQFPALSDDDWLAWSKRSWTQGPDGLIASYDINLGNTLNDFDPEQPIPDLWDQFDALATVPIMVIRGALSDLLSVETVAMMRQRRPDLDVFAVPNQGHAPLLSETLVLRQIGAFCRRCDAAKS